MDLMTPYTRAHYALLPEGFPAQLVEGQLVRDPAPAFGHQRITLEIAEALKRLVGSRRVAIAPVDVPLDDWNVYQPDVVVFRNPVDDDADPDDPGPPLLVVEVLSPSTAQRDRVVKRIRLLEAGVEEVWLVDRANKMVEVFDQRRPDVPRRAFGEASLESLALVGFALTPAALF